MNGFGRALRTLRKEARLTQAALGAKVFVTESHIAGLEGGRRTPPLELATAIDDALDADGLLIHLAEADKKGHDVRRRAFLHGLAKLSGLGVVSAHELGEAVRVSLQATLGDEATVEDWVNIADEYGRSYMTTGAEELRRSLTGDLLVLREHVADDDHPALRTSAARIAVIYGMTEAGAGDPGSAVRWYRTARRAADASNDTTTRVWTRGREAFTRAYEGSPPATVLALAGDAIAMSTGRPSLGLLEAHLAQSHAYASLGVAAAALDAIDAARRVYPGVLSDDAGTVYSMPPWRMAMACSLTLARVGEPADADAMREEADQLRPAEMVRYGAHLQMHRALLLARTGDPSACETARTALEAIPPEQRSLSLQLFAAEVLDACGDRDTEAARALLEILETMK